MSRSGAELAQALLRDAFERIHEGVPQVIEGLTVEQLRWRPGPAANHIGWLVWHLARQQDEQLAALAAIPSVWREGDWATRMQLPYPPDAFGYGMTSEEVGAFRLNHADLLTDYHHDVHALTLRVIDGLDVGDYARVLDPDFDPPVTVAVRLVSVAEDAAKHLGQAEYVRGLVQRPRR